jgi:hypothetical protein
MEILDDDGQTYSGYVGEMSRRPRAIALGLGIGWGIAVLVMLTRMGNPVDAWCYYGFDPANPWASEGCFLYSPPIEMVMGTVQATMSFEVFTFLLRAAELVVLILVAGPSIGLLLFIPAVAIELNAANINVLIVGAVLIGFRHPWAWAFVILTKVTPGVGILWFAVRREWRNFAIASGATLAIAVASRLAAPDLWHQYFAALGVEPDGSVLQIWWRLPVAALVVVWAARNDHRWALLVAVFLAMPRLYFLSPVILVGLFQLVRLPRPLPWLMVPGWLRARLPQPAAATSEGRTIPAPSS